VNVIDAFTDEIFTFSTTISGTPDDTIISVIFASEGSHEFNA